MSTSLAKRTDTRAYLVPPVLTAKSTVSRRDKIVRVYGTINALALSCTAAILVWMPYTFTGLFLIPTIVLCALFFTMACFFMWIVVDQESPARREKQILFERNRLNSPHHADRLDRAPDVESTHYSVWVGWRGTSVVISLVEHNPNGKRFRAAFGSFGYSDTEGWGSGTYTVNDPTLERIATRLNEAEREARLMEESSYDEAVKTLRAQRLALIIRRPQTLLGDVDLDDTLTADEKKLRAQYLHGEIDAKAFAEKVDVKNASSAAEKLARKRKEARKQYKAQADYER